MEQNLYQILQTLPDASTSEIKKNYQKLVKTYHPDRNHSEGSSAHFLKIQSAWSVLKDPESRKQYNLSLKTIRSKPKHEEQVLFYLYQNQYWEDLKKKYQAIQRELDLKDASTSFLILKDHFRDHRMLDLWLSQREQAAIVKKSAQEILKNQYSSRDFVVKSLKALGHDFQEIRTSCQRILNPGNHRNSYLEACSLYLIDEDLQIWPDDSWANYAHLHCAILNHYLWPKTIPFEPQSKLEWIEALHRSILARLSLPSILRKFEYILKPDDLREVLEVLSNFRA